jgi:hypothetical protein
MSDMVNPIGLESITKVVDDLFDLWKLMGSDKNNIPFRRNVIFNVTELINSEYALDLEKFRVMTTQINFIINDVEIRSGHIIYDLMIFPDNKVSNLEQVNLIDLLGVFDINLDNFTHLSKCPIHLNRLYLPEQFNMIPCLKYSYFIKLYEE